MAADRREARSVGDKQRFTHTYSTAVQPYLAGHRLFGTTLVAAATQLELLRHALWTRGEGGGNADWISLQNVVFCAPLILHDADTSDDGTEEDKRLTKVIITQSFSCSGSVAIKWSLSSGMVIVERWSDAENALGSDGAVFMAHLMTEKPETERVCAFEERPQERDWISVLKPEFYAYLRQRGYDYSGEFLAVEEAHFRKVEQEEEEEEEKKKEEEPSLHHRCGNERRVFRGGCRLASRGERLDTAVDGLLQAMALCLLKDDLELSVGAEALVPFLVDRVEMRRFRTPDAELRGLFCVKRRTLTGRCELTSADGRKWFFAENVQFRRVQRSALDPSWSPAADRRPSVRYGIRSMACRLPGGCQTPADFWRLLTDGRVTDARIPVARVATRDWLIGGRLVEGANFVQDDVADFDATFFGVSNAEAAAMDPQHRLMLECCQECMENAGRTSLDGDTGFFVGVMGTEYPDLPEASGKRDMLGMIGSATSIASGRLNHFFNANGPSMTVDTACSSSLAALDAALHAMAAGQCRRAVVAGVNLIVTEKGMHQRANGRMLSWDGACRTFDAHASGYGRADGCVTMLVEPVDGDPSAYEALIDAVSVNHDGRSTSLTAPNPHAQERLIRSCLRRAMDVDGAANLAFWECHGTGTPLGDPIEFVALRNAVSQHANTVAGITKNSVENASPSSENRDDADVAKDPRKTKAASELWISSAKATIGHGEAAAGLIGVMKAVLQLQHGYIPRFPRFCVLNEQIRQNCRPATGESRQLPIPVCGAELTEAADRRRCCGVSAFGVSGTNACTILSLPSLSQKPPVDDVPPRFAHFLRLIPISGKTTKALERNIESYRKLVETLIDEKKWIKILALCEAAATRRTHYCHRATIRLGRIGGADLRVERGGECQANNPRIRYDLRCWSTFDVSFYLRCREYRRLVQNAMALLEIDRLEAMCLTENETTLRVVDAYAKFKMLMNFGAAPTQAARSNSRFSTLLHRLLNAADVHLTKRLLKDCIRQHEREEVVPMESFSTLHDDSTVLSIAPSTTLNNVSELECLISDLYRRGVHLDWTKIYSLSSSSKSGRKLGLLPNYGFDRQRHWLSPPPSLLVVDHPLIGARVVANESGALFENLISTNRLQALQNVHVDKEKVLCFGAMAEMLIASVILASTRAGLNDDWSTAIRIRKIDIRNLQKLSAEEVSPVSGTWMRAKHSTDEQLVELFAGGSSDAPFCTASVETIGGVEAEIVDGHFRPRGVHQQIEHRQFVEQIRRIAGVDYAGFPPVDIYLDAACNICELKVGGGVAAGASTPPQRGAFIVNPVLLESFVQILLNYGRVKSYAEIGKSIEAIEVYGGIDGQCFVRTNENVVEARDVAGRLALRFVVVPSAEESWKMSSSICSNITAEEKEEEVEEEKNDELQRERPAFGWKNEVTKFKHHAAKEISEVEDPFDVADAFREKSYTPGEPFPDVVKRSVRTALRECLLIDSQQQLHDDFDTNETGFVDLGLDSLSLIGFMNKLNDESFPGLGLTPMEIFSHPNVNALTRLIMKRTSAADSTALSRRRSGGGEGRTDFRRYAGSTTNGSTKIPYSSSGDASRSPGSADHIQSFRKQSIMEESRKGNDEADEISAYYSTEVVVRADAASDYDIQVTHSNERLHLALLAYPDGGQQRWDVTSARQCPAINEKIMERILAKNDTTTEIHVRLAFLHDDVPILEAAEFLRGFAFAMLQRHRRSRDTPFIHLSVAEDRSALNAMARGMFWCLAAERPDRLRTAVGYRMERLKSLNCSLPAPAPCGAWVITGGTSGIGFEMADFLATNYNVTFVGLLARRAALSAENADRLKRTRRFCDVELFQADVSNYDELRAAFEAIQRRHLGAKRIEGVIHSAGLAKDALLELHTTETFARPFLPKAVGIRNVERALSEFRYLPRFFIVNSSISAVLGNRGQTSYVAANAYADQVCGTRYAQRLPATIIHWGNWLDVGMAERGGVNDRLKRAGLTGLRTDEAMRYFRYVLESNPPEITVARIDWPRLMRDRPDLESVASGRPLGAHEQEEEGEDSSEVRLIRQTDGIVAGKHSSRKCETMGVESGTENFKNMEESANRLQPTSKDDSSFSAITRFVTSTIAHYIGSDAMSSSSVDPDCGMMELGLDSLKLYLLAADLNRKFATPAFSISVMDLFEHSTPAKLAKYIHGCIQADALHRLPTMSSLGKVNASLRDEETSPSSESATAHNSVNTSPATSTNHRNTEIAFQNAQSGDDSRRRAITDFASPKFPDALASDNMTTLRRRDAQALPSSTRTLPVTLSDADLETILQHRVADECVAPAALHIHLLGSGCIQRQSNLPIFHLKDVDLTTKLTLDDVIPTLEVAQGFDNFVCLRSSQKLFSRCRSATAAASSDIPAEPLREIAANPLLRVRSASSEASAFYDRARRSGLDYGPTFRRLVRIRIGGNDVRADVAETSASPSTWVLYDIALQALSVVPLSRTGGVYYYIPVRISRLWKNRGLEEMDWDGKRMTLYGRITAEENNWVEGTVYMLIDDQVYICMERVLAVGRKHAHPLPSEAAPSPFGQAHKAVKRKALPMEPPKRSGDQTALKQHANDRLSSSSDKPSNRREAPMFSSLTPKNLPIRHKALPKRSPTTRRHKNNEPGIQCVDSGVQAHGTADKPSVIVRGWSRGFCADELEEHCRSKDAFDFDAEFFDITPKEAPFMDPQQRWILEATLEALESAGLRRLSPDTGVFIGASSSDFSQKIHSELSTEQLTGFLATGTNASVIAGRVAHYFGCAGPTETVDTACSSFCVSLGKACDALVANRCRMAVVGAVNVLLNDTTTEVLRKLGVLSVRQRCATFDVEADGYRRSSGVGVVILEAVKRSVGREYLLGNGVSHEIQVTGWSARHSGGDAAALTASSSVAQYRAMREAIALAGITESDIQWIECHGSATSLGDPVEVASILRMERSPNAKNVLLTSSKSRFGHCEAAAGAAAIIYVLNAISSGRVHSNRHFQLMNPRIRSVYDANKGIVLPIIGTELSSVENVLINNFGLSGVNACITLRVHTLPHDSAHRGLCAQPPCKFVNCNAFVTSSLLVISAKSDKSLEAAVENLDRHMRGSDGPINRSDAKRLCDLFQHARAQYGRHRRVILVDFVKGELRSVGADSLYNSSTLTVRIDRISNARIIIQELLRNHRGFRRMWRKRRLGRGGRTATMTEQHALVITIIDLLVKSDVKIDRIVVDDDGLKVVLESFEFPTHICSKHEILSRRNAMFDDDSTVLLSEIIADNLTSRPSLRLNRFFGRLFASRIKFNFDIVNPVDRAAIGEAIQRMRNVSAAYYCFARHHYTPFPIKLLKFDGSMNATPGVIGTNAIQAESVSCTTTSSVLEESTSDCSGGGTMTSTLKRTSEEACVGQSFDDVKRSRGWIYSVEYDVVDEELVNVNACDEAFALIPFAEHFSNLFQAPRMECLRDVEMLRDERISTFVITWRHLEQDFRLIDSFQLLQRVIELFAKRDIRFVIFVAEEADIDEISDVDEISAFLRSAASERPNLRYRIVHINPCDEIDRPLLLKLISKRFSTHSEVLKRDRNGDLFISTLRRLDSLSSTTADGVGVNIAYKKVLITGGGRGIGARLARQIDAQEVITVSRSDSAAEKGPNQQFFCVDICNFEELRRLFSAQAADIDAIFHCAGDVSNQRLMNLNGDDYAKVFAAKVRGTRNLLTLASLYGVKRFVAVSSAAAILGSVGQANYSVANAAMTRICHEYALKHSDSINIAVCSLGPVVDCGMLAGPSMSAIRRQVADGGWGMLYVDEVLQFVLQSARTADGAGFHHRLLFGGDCGRIAGEHAHLRNFLRNCHRPPPAENQSKPIFKINHEAMLNVEKMVSDVVQQVSGIGEPPDDTIGLMSLGLDSMMVEEVRVALSERFCVKISVTEMFEFVTIKDLAKLAAEKAGKRKELMAYFNPNQDDTRNGGKTTQRFGEVKHSIEEAPTITKKPQIEEKIQNSMTTLLESGILALSKTSNFSLSEDGVKHQEDVKQQKSDPIGKAGESDAYSTFLKADDIAVIGMSGAFSGAATIEELWDGVLSGREMLTTAVRNESDDENDLGRFVPVSGTLPNTDAFDPAPFQLSEEASMQLDPQVRHILMHARAALESSGYMTRREAFRIGCFVGAEPSGFVETTEPSAEFDDAEGNKGSLMEMYRSNQKDFCAMWISHLLNLNGPSAGVYSACSSSILAINNASSAILNGSANICLAGAVHMVPEYDIGHHYVPGMVLSAAGKCRPFCGNKNGGILRGSGCAVVVLKRATVAYRDGDHIMGVIKACHMNNDGGVMHKSNFMAPSARGQRDVMLGAARRAGVDFRTLSYLECHGTGTKVGDSMELKAICDVHKELSKNDGFDRRPNQKLIVGSVKANIGHAFAASGMASLAKCLKILSEKLVPSQLGDCCDVDVEENSENVVELLMGVGPKRLTTPNNQPLYVAINNFGIGGTNGTMILMEGPDRFLRSSSTTTKNIGTPLLNYGHALLPISAATPKSCLEMCSKLATYIMAKIATVERRTMGGLENAAEEASQKGREILRRIAATLCYRREPRNYRVIVVAGGLREAADKLRAVRESDIHCSQRRLSGDNLAMFFCPQGVQYPNMLRNELAASDWLKERLHKLNQLYVGQSGGPSLYDILSGDAINDVRYTQLALFAVSRLISDFLHESFCDKEFVPKVALGHSVGEYSALVEAKAIDEAQCLKLLAHRGRLMRETAPAKMLIVTEGPSDSEILTSFLSDMEISAVLAPNIRAVVGPPAVIDRFRAAKKDDPKVECRVAKTAYGFHSSFLAPISDEFLKLARLMTYRCPCTAIISNVDGELLGVDRLGAEYLCQHMVQPVRMDLSLMQLQKCEDLDAIVEVGPPGMLKNLLKLTGHPLSIIHTVQSYSEAAHHPQSLQLFDAIGALWCRGFDVDFRRLMGDCDEVEPNLPTYAFDLRKYEKLPRNKFTPENANKIFQQCWKCVPQMELKRKRPSSTKKVICLYSMTSLSSALENQICKLSDVPVIFVRLTDEPINSNSERESTDKYVVNVSDHSFRLLQNTLSLHSFDIVLYCYSKYCNPQIDVAATRAGIRDAFTATRMIGRHLRLTENGAFIAAHLCNNCNTTDPFFRMAFASLSESRNVNKSIRNIAAIEFDGESTSKFDSVIEYVYQKRKANLEYGNFEYYEARNGTLTKMFYEEIPSYEELFEHADSFLPRVRQESANGCSPEGGSTTPFYSLLFGGTGSVGVTFANRIAHAYPDDQLVFISRNATKCAEKLRSKFGNSDYYDVDIGDCAQVELFMHRIHGLGRCRYVIHCSGVMPSVEEVGGGNDVFWAKVFGTRNLIDALNKLNFKIDTALILNSSLTAVNGIPGADDYAAANLFLDAIADNRFYLGDVPRIVSVQWTAWTRSSMFQRSRLSNDSFVRRNGIAGREASRMIDRVLLDRTIAGVYAVSRLNPRHSRRYFVLQQNRPELGAQQPAPCDEPSVGRIESNAALYAILRKMWKEALPFYKGSDEVKDDDDFFACGGNSLNGVQLVWRLERTIFGGCRRVPIRWIFENPRFVDFVKKILKERNDEPSADKETIEDRIVINPKRMPHRIPLSLQQEQMWLLWALAHHSHSEDRGIYNIIFRITLTGSVNIEALRYCIMRLVTEQSSLRTRFRDENAPRGKAEAVGQFQEVLSLTEAFYCLNVARLDKLDESEVEELERDYAFDLRDSSAPLRIRTWKAKGTGNGREQCVLLLNHYHILTDGWSMTVFAREFEKHYRAYTESTPDGSRFNDLEGGEAIRYSDYAIWSRRRLDSERFQHLRRDYASRLETLPDGGTRLTPSRRISSTMKASKFSTLQISVPLQTTWRLAAFCAERRTTAYTVFLAAFLRIVDMWRAVEEDASSTPIVIGCPVSGRTNDQLSRLIGYFINNIVISIESRKLWSENVINNVKVSVDEAIRFSEIPFHTAVAAAKRRKADTGNAVFQIFFNYRHNLEFPSVDFHSAQIEASVEQVSRNHVFEFSCTVDEVPTSNGNSEAKTRITFDYDSGLFEDALVKSFGEGFLEQISLLCQNGDDSTNKWKSRISFGKSAEIPNLSNLIQIVCGQCCKTPNEPAIARVNAENLRIVTYSTLNAQISEGAALIGTMFFEATGCSLVADDIVPLIFKNNRSLISWQLSVMATGAAFSVIAAETPRIRMCAMVRQLRAKLVLSDHPCAVDGCRMMNINELGISKAENSKSKSAEGFVGNVWMENKEVPDDRVTPLSETRRFPLSPSNSRVSSSEERLNTHLGDNSPLAYVCFTSGTTGEPKGVCVTQKNLLSFACGATRDLGISSASRVGQTVSGAFDVSMFNVFASLVNGACLVQMEAVHDYVDGTKLKKAARSLLLTSSEEPLFTHLFLTSAVFNALGDTRLLALATVTEHLIVGGETPSTSALQRCLGSGDVERLKVTQIYGPTETTVWSIIQRMCKSTIDGTIIGTPCSNEFTLLIPQSYSQSKIDPSIVLAERSLAVGELCVGGVGVARGYLKSAIAVQTTATGFVDVENVGRIYRTGDLVQRVPSCADDYSILRFVGRKDGMVKICGIRVDPSEVRNAVCAALHELSGEYFDVFVTADNIEAASSVEGGRNELIAFVGVEEMEKWTHTLIETLKLLLRGVLPYQAIPNFFIPVAKLPLSAVGKVDRRELEKAFRKWLGEQRKTPASGVREVDADPTILRRIHRLWQNLLPGWSEPSETKAVNTNFFAAGGHSLLLYYLCGELTQEFTIDKFCPDIGVNELHRFPTIAAQGRLIRQMITQSQAMSNISEVQKTSESPTEVPPEVPSDIIALLRSSPPTATTDKQVLDIYCIHAIGGTFYPYYPILQIFPDWCRLYGVRYAPTLPCTSLLELAKVYASCILRNGDYSASRRFLLVGHSLGGILAREIAIIINEQMDQQFRVPFIIAFDSWTIGTDALDLGVVRAYLTEQFELMPNKAELLDAAMRLAVMLREHTFRKSDVGVRLFKAKSVENSTLRNSIRRTLDQNRCLSTTDNGWSAYADSLEVLLCEGEHDSILRMESLSPFRELIEIYCQQIQMLENPFLKI